MCSSAKKKNSRVPYAFIHLLYQPVTSFHFIGQKEHMDSRCNCVLFVNIEQ